MGGSQSIAKQGNDIARASLAEQQRQYTETQAKENAKKEAAKSNAFGSRQSANMAYSNNFNQSTDFTTGQGGTYSLLTAGGTPSIIGTMLSGDQQMNTTLG